MKPILQPHEETLISWWRLGNTCDNFDCWMDVGERCYGASIAMMDLRGNGPARASMDYAIASALATRRAIETAVTPSPAPVSPAMEAA